MPEYLIDVKTGLTVNAPDAQRARAAAIKALEDADMWVDGWSEILDVELNDYEQLGSS